MCLCCATKAKTIKKNILPGYNLLKGVIDHPDWPKDFYALQQRDDPDFIWEFKVTPEPKGNFNRNKAAYLRWAKWAKETEVMEKSFQSDPRTGYDLYKASLKAGYRPKRDGFRFVYWLRNHLAQKLKRS